MNEVPLSPRRSPNKNINDNCEEQSEEYSSKDGFLYRLFGGILF